MLKKLKILCINLNRAIAVLDYLQIQANYTTENIPAQSAMIQIVDVWS
ncbi:hypothetical protein QUB80_19025 [Chlorogloeopsis sp. ULAP01]|nr:hypothetical protein [Chlorogloeopsis sp. ULAP01]MDM9382789.1 hypothetical protein [Chlorogloeopsis sp. ULAP01]